MLSIADEFVLVRSTAKLLNSTGYRGLMKGPVQADIDRVTSTMTASRKLTMPIVNIEELVLQSDVSKKAHAPTMQ